MDESLLRAVNALAAEPWVATLGVVLSSRWMIPVVCGPLALLMIRRRRWIPILSVALAMGASDLIVARIMKPIVGRDRPCRQLTGIERPVRCGAGRSFPSGHAAVSFAFLVSAAPLVRLGWVIFTPIASAIAGSRVLLGVHYPTDVGAGALFGSMIGAGAWMVRRRYEPDADPSPSSAPASDSSST